MALPASFLEELRARTPLHALIEKRVRLTRSGHNWKGCCPFHGEKTPSFYVYDDHFHCFGCGAHGDAISYVMQAEGASFPEAVERLAGEAGLSVPKPSPEAAAAEARRLGLAEALEAAEAGFRRRLAAPEGAAARAYLLGRGLAPETIDNFALGYSGDGRGSLTAELTGQGFTADTLLEAGLLRETEGQERRELFYNRVMFPIRDRRGRVISFGGRLLGPGQPKYVNGPESPVFSKRRSLYALDRARAAARAGQRIVVVEGYMDVIALHQAGFTGAVAPLGTALTEEQIQELWQLSPAPVLCFDGDAAGGRAAARAASLVLPLLSPEHSLSIAALPSGEDPDTLVASQGPAGFQAVLDAARPLAEAVFDLLRDPAAEATPEGRAAFLGRLDAAAGQIPDRALAAEYRHALRERYYALHRPARRASSGGAGWTGGTGGKGQRGTRGFAPANRAGLTRPALPRPTPGPRMVEGERARILTAILLRHPALLADVADAYAGLDLPAPFARLRAALLDLATQIEEEGAEEAFEADARARGRLDSAALMSHLTSSGLAAEATRALSADPVPLPGCADASAMPGEAASGWWHIFGLMNRGRLEEEVAAAGRDFATRADGASERRLVALTRALAALRQGGDGLDGGDPGEQGRPGEQAGPDA